MDEPILNPPADTPELNTTINPVTNDVDSVLHLARQRRSRIRAKTEEIIDRQNRITQNRNKGMKEIICWVVALSLFAGFVYYSYIKFAN